MEILSANVQSRWPDSFAGSEQVKLTLRANGEEMTQIIDATGTLWPAGFDAPTSAPSGAASASSGSYAAGDYVAYRYAYASSKYPFVANAVTGGGEQWPRSAPSDASSAVAATAAKAITVTVTGTTRLDVDWIWIYRTAARTSSALADDDAAAGLMYYCGRVANPGLAVAATFSDTGATLTTIEALELDNFPAPTFWKTVFDGTYWWGFGNPSFDAEVTLDGATGVTLADASLTKWFPGRSGQPARFDGITSGGYDGRGTFYFGVNDNTTGTLYLDADLTTPLSTGYTGTTKIHIQGPSATLYRSKERNPFSWGWTQENTDDENNTTLVPQEWALNVGGGNGTAIAFLPDDNRLKLDLEGPAKTVTFELNQAAESPDSFATLKRTLSSRYSVGSHHSQFAADLEEGRPALLGLDAKNWAILACDGEIQQPISTKVFATLRAVLDDDGEERFFHGVYDPRTELACWWVKTVSMTATNPFVTNPTNKCDTMIWFHAPTGCWGVTPDQDISASALVYDPVNDENLVLVGSEQGLLGRAFSPEQFHCWADADEDFLTGTVVDNGAFSTLGFSYTPAFNLLDVSDAGGFARIHGDSTDGMALLIGQTVEINGSGGGGMYDGIWTVTDSEGGAFAVISAPFAGDSGSGGSISRTFSSDYAGLKGAWMLLTDASGGSERWGRIYTISGGNIAFDRYYLQDAAADLTIPNPLGIPVGWKWYLGAIPCRARTYFDLKTPSKAKRGYELWTTMENVDPDTDAQYVRFYREYAQTLAASGDSFALIQNPQGNGSDSITWANKTRVPSWLTWQFGLEFVERGYLNWTLYDATLKVNTAS